MLLSPLFNSRSLKSLVKEWKLWIRYCLERERDGKFHFGSGDLLFTAKLKFRKTFRTSISLREESAANYEECAAKFFTNGSKTESGIVSRISSDSLDISVSQLLLCRNIDSLAAIKALNFNVVKSKCLYHWMLWWDFIIHHQVKLI